MAAQDSLPVGVSFSKITRTTSKCCTRTRCPPGWRLVHHRQSSRDLRLTYLGMVRLPPNSCLRFIGPPLLHVIATATFYYYTSVAVDAYDLRRADRTVSQQTVVGIWQMARPTLTRSCQTHMNKVRPCCYYCRCCSCCCWCCCRRQRVGRWRRQWCNSTMERSVVATLQPPACTRSHSLDRLARKHES